jgi:hypothetical protein
VLELCSRLDKAWRSGMRRRVMIIMACMAQIPFMTESTMQVHPLVQYLKAMLHIEFLHTSMSSS